MIENKRKSWIVLLIIILNIIVLANPISSSNLSVHNNLAPVAPILLWGQAYLDDVLLPEGELITSWIDGTQYGFRFTVIDGWFDINTEGEWTHTLGTKDGGFTDDLVVYAYESTEKVYFADRTDIFITGWVYNHDLYFNSTIDSPSPLKINELSADDGLGSQYAYLYNPSATSIVLDDYYLEKDIPGSDNGYNGTTKPLTGIINAQSTSFIDLGASGFLETSADELKLVWNNTGSIIADGNDIVIDRVEYGNQDLVPDNTTLLDATTPPSGWAIRRTPTGQDTDDCSADFQLYNINPIANFDIPLMGAGWHLMSLPLDINGHPSDVLDDSPDGTTEWDVVMTYDDGNWLTYSIYKPPILNTLDYLDNTMGFWVHITDPGDGRLTFTGPEPSGAQIQIKTGWNLVGWPSLDPSYTVSDLKFDSGFSVTRVERFNPFAPYDIEVMPDAATFQMGGGYWIYSTSDILWFIS